MVGLLHRIQLGTAPRALANMFPKARRTIFDYTLGSRQRHIRQFENPVGPGTSPMKSRSLFGLVRVYNDLPQHIVDAQTVKLFQLRLLNMVKDAASKKTGGWETMFCAC